MQAIVTKYLGATNTKPSRIKATASAGSVTISYSYDHDTEGCHRQAAQALCDKFGWKGSFVTGGLPNGDYVHVFTN